MTTAKIAYHSLSINNLGHSEIEITAEISPENLGHFKASALKKFGEKTKLDGFRPGHIPKKVLVDRIGEQVILEEAAQLALADVYPAIVKDKKLDVIGRPEVTITKLADGNPLCFKIKTAVLPTFELPDYKASAQEILSKKEVLEVSPKEIDDIILDIRKTRAQNAEKQNQEEHGASTPPILDTAGNSILTKAQEGEKKDLPDLTDEEAKTFGDFKSISDFRKHIKGNLIKEKEVRAKEKKRVEIGEALIKKINIELPNVLIESELHKMFSQFKDDITRMGLDYQEYLKKIDKTEEKLREEWREVAGKKAKLQLILNKIAEAESIIPDSKEMERQVAHLLEHYKNADPDRARIYIETLLTNEKVFEFLERQKN